MVSTKVSSDVCVAKGLREELVWVKAAVASMGRCAL